MKPEPNTGSPDRVRQGCDRVEGVFHALGTRMDAGKCQSRQGRQGRFWSSLEKKEYRVKRKKKKEERRESAATTLSTLSEVTLSSIHAACSPVFLTLDPVGTLSDPVANGKKAVQAYQNAKSLNTPQLAGLTKGRKQGVAA